MMSDFVSESSITLVGKPVINWGGLFKFLDYHEKEWEEVEIKATETPTPELNGKDAEWLVEAAGRTCYMSWPEMGCQAKGRDHENHIKHLIEMGHGSCLEHVNFNFELWNISRSLSHELVRHRTGVAYCLHGDTLVWDATKCKNKYDGKKKPRTIRQIYDWSLDPKRKGRIKLMFVRCFDGKKFVQAHIKSVCRSKTHKKLFKITLTDGKTIIASKQHKFMVMNNNKNEWLPLEKISVGDKIATNGELLYKNKDWLDNKYNNENLSQLQIGNICNVSVHTIRTWVRKFGLQKPIGSWSKNKTPWNKNKKYIAGWHHSDQTKKILSLVKMGDKNPSWKGDFASEQAGRLRGYRQNQALKCKKCGSTIKIHRHHIDRNTLNNNISNISFLCSSCHAKLHYKEDGPTSCLTIKPVEISSIEYCCEDYAYDIEINHPAHNFVANGIVTHNSQLSQRYVDSSNVKFIIPPAIQELKNTNPELYHKWKDFCLQSRDFYAELTEALSELYCDLSDKTEKRKKARQAARSVLPNATETKIFWTANGRAVRHIIETRANQAADLEIRNLAVKLFDIMQKEFPLICHGMRLVKLSDGTNGVESDFKKV